MKYYFYNGLDKITRVSKFPEFSNNSEKYYKYKKNKTINNDNYSDSRDLNNLMIEVRIKRNKLLNETIWMYERHQQEKELIVLSEISETTLTTQKYNEWLIYWQTLRDITKDVSTVDDVSKIAWPNEPG